MTMISEMRTTLGGIHRLDEIKDWISDLEVKVDEHT